MYLFSLLFSNWFGYFSTDCYVKYNIFFKFSIWYLYWPFTFSIVWEDLRLVLSKEELFERRVGMEVSRFRDRFCKCA